MDAPPDEKKKVVFPDEIHETPMQCAARDVNHELVEERVGDASGIDGKDQQEKTPLLFAAKGGHSNVGNIRLQHVANPSGKKREHWTPLMCAADLGKEESWRDILSATATVDDKNMDGDTALHIACRRGHVGVVTLLMDHEASLNDCNKIGVTCFQAAARGGNSKVVFAMIKHQRWAEIMEHKDKKGRTPMKLLIKHFPESAKVLMDHCIDGTEMESSDDPNLTITFNLRFLDPGPTDSTCLGGSRFFGPSTIAKHERRELLFHPLTQVLLNKKWSSFGRLVFYFSVLCNFVFVATFTVLLYEDLHNISEPLFWVVLSLVIFQFTKEVMKIFVQRLKYFTVLSNLTRWIFYGMFFLPYLTNDSDDSTFKAIMIFLCYANLVLVLRQLGLVGIYVVMFIEVTKSVLKVLLVFFFLFFGFSMVFHVLFEPKGKVFKYLGIAILKVAVMTVGEVDFEEKFMPSKNLTSWEPTFSEKTSFVFLGLFMVLMTIVLMNLLVGLAVGDIDAIRRNAAFKKMAMHVEYIANVEKSFPRCISRRFYHPEVVLRPNRRTLRKSIVGNIRLQHVANPSSKKREHWAPLMCAADLGKEESCRDILNANATVDDKNMDGDTALHIACRRGHVGVVTLLMDHGASLNDCNKIGVTCFQAAARGGNSKVAFAMIKHQRWTEIMEHKDKKGRTPMKLLIKHFPESAEVVMDHCINGTEIESFNDPNLTITFNFRFLDPSPTDCTRLGGRRFFGPSTMVKHERRELLFHPLTQVLLNKKWSSFGRLVFYFNFLCYFAFVAMITACYLWESQFFCLAALFLAGTQLEKEFITICVQRLRYCTLLSNLTEFIHYSAYFVLYIVELLNPASVQALNAIGVFLCYTNLVLVLRWSSLVGIYVTMFIEVTKSVLKVLLIFFVLFFGFSMVFHVLFKSKGDPFDLLGIALLKVAVMTIGEVDFEKTFTPSKNLTDKQTSSEIASFVFLGLFVVLMTIVLMNLLVGLAVGDIDAIQRNAAFKRMAMHVKYIANVEKSFPRCILRRFYHAEVVLTPNRRTLRKRLMVLLGMKTSSGLDFTPRAKEELYAGTVSDSTEIKKKPDLPEKRTREVQNALFGESTRDIDPGTEMDTKSPEIKVSTADYVQMGTSASGGEGDHDEQELNVIKTTFV